MKDRFVGDFEILEDSRQPSGLWKLGEGTFGITYQARSRVIKGDLVALKVLKFKKDDKRFESFCREADTLRRLEHPNIARFRHVGIYEDFPYCAMELCEGGSLQALVNEVGALPVPLILLIGRQLAAALDHAHNRVGNAAIVHRDIKPDNAMIGRWGESGKQVIKLIDFGLAKAFNRSEEGASTMASMDGFKGSYLFASPEQLKERGIEPRSDLYSLGMTLWYLAEGDRPPPFKDLSEAEIQSLHLSSEKFDLSMVDDWLRQPLERLLAKNIEERFLDASEVEAEFANLIEAWEGAQEEHLDLEMLISGVKSGASSGGSPAFSLGPESDSLEQVFDIEHKETWESSIGPVYAARAKREGDRKVSLVLVNLESFPDGSSADRARQSLSRLVEKLTSLSHSDRFPGSIIVPKSIRWFESGELVVELDYFDDAKAISILEFNRATKRVEFRDLLNLGLASDLAEALDYFTQAGLPTPGLNLDQMFLVDRNKPDSSIKRFLNSPVSGWPPMKLELNPLRFDSDAERSLGLASNGAGSTGTNGMGTVAGRSSGDGNAGGNPVASFAALLYRLISGMPVAGAAFNTPGGYSNIRGVTPEGNQVLQTAIANPQLFKNGCCEVLREFCDAEVEELPLRIEEILQFGIEVPEVESQASTPKTTTANRPPPPPVSPRVSSGPRSSTTGTTPPPATVETAPPPKTIPTDPSWEQASKAWVEDGAGKAVSPYTGDLITVPPTGWRPRGHVLCEQSDRYFLLPDEVEPLVARVSRPLRFITPYLVDQTHPQYRQEISDERLWIEGGVVRCQATGLEVRLPDHLPPLEAIVDPKRPGEARAPQQPSRACNVPPDDWVGGNEVDLNGIRAVLPKVLPDPIVVALEDLDAENATVKTPFADELFQVPIDHWVGGAFFRCEVTGCFYRFPSEIPHRVARIIDGRMGLVEDPFTGQERSIPGKDWEPGKVLKSLSESGGHFQLPESNLPDLEAEPVTGKPGFFLDPYGREERMPIPVDSWEAGARVATEGGRFFVLPEHLPELPEAKPVESGSARASGSAFVRPPYKGSEPFEVEEEDWIPSKIFREPATNCLFRLPTDLPPLVKPIELVAEKPGFEGEVVDPWSGKKVAVSGPRWNPGEVVASPEPGRAFQLPKSLPPLAGQALASGHVKSPYAPDKSPFEVKPSEWREGNEVVCPHTSKKLVLRSLPLLLGALSLERPGEVTSPHAPEKPILLKPSQWEPEAEIEPPDGGPHFRLPGKLLKLPEGSFEAPHFDTVRSPYSRKHEKITITDWKKGPGGVVACKSSGLLFRLPGNLPPQPEEGKILPRQVSFYGAALSPEGEEVLEIAGANWIRGGVVETPSKKFFRLPDEELPELIARPLPESEQGCVGKVYSPFAPEKVQEVSGEDWLPGKRIACEFSADRVFRLPERKDLPLLEARVDADAPGIATCPYSGAELFPDASHWRKGAEIDSGRKGWPCRLPTTLPDLETASADAAKFDLPAQKGWVVSPYAPKKDPIEVPFSLWTVRSPVRCTHTGKLFRLPSKLPSWVKVAEVDRKECGFKGSVLSPWEQGHRIEVEGSDWTPGKQLSCDKSGRAFALPLDADALPPLMCRILDGAKGRVQSPYVAGPEGRFEANPDEWNEGGKIVCPVSKRISLLPHQLPPLAVELLPNEPGIVLSPFGKRERILVPADKWKPGAELIVEGRKVCLPDGKLPEPKLAIIREEKPGEGVSALEVKSPYQGKVVVPVDRRDWRGGALLRCPKTGCLFALPPEGKLPTVAQPGGLIEGHPGRIVSPYSGEPVDVPGPDWEAGGMVACPGTPGFYIRLPEELPPMEAKPGDEPGKVRTPYAKGEPAVEIAADDWKEGNVVPCPATGRPLRLPSALPLLEGEVDKARPGLVRSPFSEDDEPIAVEAANWRPRETVKGPKSGRSFRLPDEANLPRPLPARKIDPVGAKVTSPYGKHGVFRFAEWKPGAVAACPETKALIALPSGKALPEAVGELPGDLDGAKTITGHSGRVCSPFSGEEIEVSGPDWERGGEVACPRTKRKFRLPSDLPALEVVIDESRPGWVRSPYAPRKAIHVEMRDWVPGGSLTCPRTRRVMVLPGKDRLPARDEQAELGAARLRQRNLRRMAIAAGVALLAGGVGLTHEKWMPDFGGGGKPEEGGEPDKVAVNEGDQDNVGEGSGGPEGTSADIDSDDGQAGEKKDEGMEVVEATHETGGRGSDSGNQDRDGSDPRESEKKAEQPSPKELLVLAATKQDPEERVALIELARAGFQEAGDANKLRDTKISLAEIYESLERWEKAEELYQELAKSDPEFFLSLADMRKSKGDPLGALQAYRQYADARTYDKSVVSKLSEAGAVAVLRERGEKVLNDDYRLARESFEAAIAVVEKGRGLGVLSANVELRELEKKVAETYLEEGDRLAEKGSWEAARSVYARVETIDPSAAGWRMGIAEEKRMEASDLEINPLNMGTLGRQFEPSWQERDRFADNDRAVDAMVSYGRLLNNTQNPGYDESKALQIYEWAAKQGNGHAAYLLGRHYHAREIYDNAVSWYDKAQSLGHQDPSLSPLLNKARNREGGGKSL